MNNSEIQLHKTFDEISEEEWNSLLQKSSTNVPFLQYGYLKRWWEYKGGGEWPECELALLSYRQDGKLAGIAPFFNAMHEGKKKTLLLGSIEISDYLDFIYDPQYAAPFFHQVFNAFSGDAFTGIDTLLLYNLPETSASIPFIDAESIRNGWKYTSEKAYRTPVIQLAGDWDTYLAGIDKKQRHEIRRKMRRAEESSANVRWYLAGQAESLDQEIDDFFKLMILDDEKKNFLTDAMREQMRSLIHWAFDEQILQLSFLSIEGIKAAAYLCFDYQQRIWVYNSGFDPQYRDYSPGWVLLSYLIQNAIRTGMHTFDFMRGDEDYKYRFGAQDSYVLKAEVTK